MGIIRRKRPCLHKREQPWSKYEQLNGVEGISLFSIGKGGYGRRAAIRYWTWLILAVVITGLLFYYLRTLHPVSRLLTSMEAKESSADMVVLDRFIPGIRIELRYASDKNIYGQRIYDFDHAYLRRGTAEKLKAAQAELSGSGYGLKVWDAYRPKEAQFKLWEKMPDARFVVNPYKNCSYHSRGAAVDLTLVDSRGKELPMPSVFDDFTARADRDYSDVDEPRAQNAKFLEKVMRKHGFDSIHYEWWHFIDSDKYKYPVIDLKDLP